jgi:uncharacterized membrane protein YeaQ/YmgE (transglycosylase-associated protein family)|tara:strand:+ start:297 stop:569 length:273 start_codon:yes stop_codon:yes gene_type:complete
MNQLGIDAMGIIAWIIFGLIAGAIAKLIMPGKDPGGFIVTIIIGILGAVVGGWIGTALGFGDVSGFNIGSFIIAVIGAIVLLIIYRVVRK